MATIRLEPMTEARYARYRERAEVDYADSIAASGLLPPSEARDKARRDHARLLPDGLRTEGQRLCIAYAGDDEVGVLWLHLERRSDGLHASVYDVEVRADRRRRGYGRAMMRAAEQLCRELGVVSIGLNVFGQNSGARALYEQLGYEVTSVQMAKRL
ncbi:N-acetyltransferase [Micromonospora sp. 4G55]|uniref:GNAT family N-acetyltransferase n=1 Tax=Micromonospora sp. 4G55 TaxID=2806102 RepID=UPI001EE4A6C6|nr:GNAT family N-acetyltransferase [Micromonospora sp. 4G55]